MKVLLCVFIVVLLYSAHSASAAGCPGGLYCGWCGCDAMYGNGWTCRTSSDHTCCWGNNFYTALSGSATCGNAVVECEDCDDGNTASGDGCSASCGVEAGWTCGLKVETSGQKSVCSPVCTGGCPTNAACVAPSVCACLPGYANQSGSCVDINECATPSLSNCSPNATCTNTPGSYYCNCTNGLFGNGSVCVENECNTGKNNCPYNRPCIKSQVSGYTCRTDMWYNINDGTSTGSACSTTSSNSSTWCMLPINAAKTQYIEFPQLQIPTNEYTIEVKWIGSQASSWSRVFEFGNGPGNDNILLGFYGTNQQLIYQPYNGAQGYSSPVLPYTLGSVARVFLTHATNQSLTFALDSSNYATSALPYPRSVSRSLNYVGRSLYVADAYLTGFVGEIRMWNRYRTLAEYTATKEVHLDAYTVYPNLVALYQVDKVCGNKLIDLTGNNQHGILQNYSPSDLFPSCYAHGTCNTTSTACTCNSGWAGVACEKFVCTAGCGGHGTCTGPNTCTCDAGFYGPTCSYTKGPSTCNSGTYCGYCGCDAMYGPGYTCRTDSDHTCCWGNNYYDHAPTSYCGNGLQECEPCDDGNILAGDGCSSNCTIEPGYTCAIDVNVAGQKSICKPVCTAGCGGHGTCTAPNVCTCDPGYGGPTCSYTIGPNTCTAPGTYCGYCGCDAMYGPGYTCRTSSDHTCCWGNNYYDQINPHAWCGNGQTECEPCDDGNNVNGDGCSSTCGVEPGYQCYIDVNKKGQTSICEPVCTAGCGGHGNCTAPNVCTCAAGFYGPTCSYTIGASRCTDAGEHCGFCSCDAQYGMGWTCRYDWEDSCCQGTDDYAPIVQPYCGNNVTECEPCDDGNIINGDGCSSTCTVEPGFVCKLNLAAQFSVCTHQ